MFVLLNVPVNGRFNVPVFVIKCIASDVVIVPSPVIVSVPLFVIVLPVFVIVFPFVSSVIVFPLATVNVELSVLFASTLIVPSFH